MKSEIKTPTRKPSPLADEGWTRPMTTEELEHLKELFKTLNPDNPEHLVVKGS